jgi:hypothetical protein
MTSLKKSTIARIYDYGYSDKSCENVLNRFYLYNQQVSEFQEQYCKTNNTYHLHMSVDCSEKSISTDNLILYYEEKRMLYYLFYYLKNIANLYKKQNPNFDIQPFERSKFLDYELVLITEDEILNSLVDELYSIHNTIYHLQLLTQVNTDKYYVRELAKYYKLENELVAKFNKIMETTINENGYQIPEPCVSDDQIQLTNHFIIIQNNYNKQPKQFVDKEYEPIPIVTSSVQNSENVIEEITTDVEQLSISSKKETTKTRSPKSKVKSPISKPDLKKNDYTLVGIQKLSVTKLVDICKEHNYKGYSGKKKEDIIRIILSNSVYQE